MFCKKEIIITLRVDIDKYAYYWRNYEVVYSLVTLKVSKNMALKVLAFTKLKVIMFIV